jgi:hypothetical protein
MASASDQRVAQLLSYRQFAGMVVDITAESTLWKSLSCRPRRRSPSLLKGRYCLVHAGNRHFLVVESVEDLLP